MDTTIQSNKWNKRTLFWEAIVLLFMFGFKFLPPLGSLTPLGMEITGIFAGAIIGWITIGMVFPNIAGIIALGFSNAYPSFVACFQSTFASDTAVMMLGCLFICAFIEITNLTDVIVGYLLNLKLAQKSIVMFFIFFYLADWLVSALASSVLAAYLFIVMYRGMTKESGIPPHTKTNSFVLCGIALIAVLGDIAFPFKPVAVTVLAILEGFLGYPFSFMDYLLYCSFFQVILIILYVLIGRYIIRVDFSKLNAAKVEQIKPNKKQAIGLWCALIMLILFTLTSFSIPIISTMKLGGAALILMLIMVFIQVDGKPMLDVTELAAKFNWPIYFLICFFFGIANFLGSDEAGITASFKTLFEPLLVFMPPIAFVIVALILSTILTNFLNNLPVAIIFISTMFALRETMIGINMEAASLAIIMASFAACATPAANPVNAITFANTDLIDTKMSLKVGSICCALLCFICIFFYFPLLSFIL